MATDNKKNKRFEIIYDKWIKNISSPFSEDETIAIRVSAIKYLKCFHNPVDLLSKEIKYYIVLQANGTQEMRFEYEENEKDEYLKDKKILEILLFAGEDVSHRI